MARSKSTKIDTTGPATLAEAVASVEDPAATLLAVIDRAVRDSRDNGWCESFESILDRVAPELAVPVDFSRRNGGPGKSYVDSNGVTCDGYDKDGFRVNGDGLHWATRVDREGFDRYGLKDGYDREGFDRNGDHRDNPAAAYRFIKSDTRYGYLTDWDGFSPDGTPAYNANGNYLTRRELNRLRGQGVEAFNLNRNGVPNPDATPVAASE